MNISLVLLVAYIAVCNGLPFADQLAANDVDNSHKWVVLCAGSNGWENYADQALVYRAYHTFRSYGIPESNIIVMHYDDIAHHTKNPNPGVVINEIGGKNLYHDIPKDYIGTEVNPTNFLGAISGDPELVKRGKKVVKSGPNDHVFVYFGDHGAPGSMFNKVLPDNINVYAVTSSLPDETSNFFTYDAKLKTYISTAYGIPDSNLIVMHYDDIANNSENTTPRIVVNDIGGPDVYKGVTKDYTGKDTFLKVLQGDAELAAAGKKVVKSGPNDHVFVYFGDHGSTDLVAFPSSYLYAKDLNAVLVKLNEEKKFAQLTIYLDTCDSGSMFRNHLPANVNVYASTSSDYDELSWFYIYDDKYKTYISSFFADNWLDNEAQSDINTETLQQQYQYLKDHHTVQNPHSNTTHEIHAQQYGDLNVAKTKVAEFLGLKPKNANRFVPHLGSNTDEVNKYDVSIDLLQRRIASAQDINEKNSFIVELEGLYAGRQYVDKHINNYVNRVDPDAILKGKHPLHHRKCYRKFVNTFNEKCFNLNKNPYALKKMQLFVNICETLRDRNDADIALNQLISYLLVNGVPFISQNDPGSIGKNWVVLCAGSGEWINYFVQADIYHAYQLVRSQGIPDENIIVMHIDDIAHNPANPTPNIIVNHGNGTDVYHGVPKHYTSDDVTIKNFLGVLQGDQELVKQGKKVVNSGLNDRKLHSGANYAIDSELPELADLADNRNVVIHLAQMNIALSEDINEKQRKDSKNIVEVFFQIPSEPDMVYEISLKMPFEEYVVFVGSLLGLCHKWVVLCAGSNGWENYADQALVYRAYHLFRSYGIPESNIIVMHYDDIAHNSKNPNSGVVINEIGGKNLYHDISKDYVGTDVNPTNFLGAISGDIELTKRGKKVVKSGPNDHVFVYFGDHRSPGSFFADNWLDNEAQSDINTETLQQQYQYLKDHHTVQNPHSNTTHEIHAQQYGYVTITKTKVAELLGELD
ncbi:unnamed protein product [Medioppia subpectinata]|uniref:legumain n=1 Tax=Medioppia subpectinata TaxID=1979941 RepID=A0A7R9PTI0_9ACAR|nr:unnamed protein product [Medioppia subpectinata]CAG2100475.1 unnamed protein product [Medioppia subpectinata]